jgi:hypothetical protein
VAMLWLSLWPLTSGQDAWNTICPLAEPGLRQTLGEERPLSVTGDTALA